MDEFYREPHKESTDRDTIAQLADSYFRQIKTMQGRNLKSIGLDVYTISEMLRLYFMTSGTTHTNKIKYWYQQRGGYTHMDECGIDFVLNDKHILNKLERASVFELEPDEKLKILTCLCHQLISHLRFRDLIDDNFQQLNTLRAQLRDLQTEENRRQREEVSERWRRKMLAKEKEKSRAIEMAAIMAAAAAAANQEGNPANASTSSTTTATNKPVSKESSTLLNEQLAREEEMAKIAEEKFNTECARKREEFLRKESKLVEEIYELQTVYSMCPLGKDRYFRRYWVFRSLPGVFVEDDDDDGGEFERMQEGLAVVKTEPSGLGEGAGGGVECMDTDTDTVVDGGSSNPCGSNSGTTNGAAVAVVVDQVKSANLNSLNNANDGKENKPESVKDEPNRLIDDENNKQLLNVNSTNNKSSQFGIYCFITFKNKIK